jgi:hypothetical protein
VTITGEENRPFSDLDLARRLEKTEARANAEFVETHARLFPESGACWIEVAGAYAMYDGAGSPVTQTFGLGLFDAVTHAEMQRIEEFYAERGAPVFHEVSPLADPALLVLLNERGYRPAELTSAMFLPLGAWQTPAAARNERVRVRLAQNEEERLLWARVAARGWSSEAEAREFVDYIEELMLITASRNDALSFLAEIDGDAVAAGAMVMHEGVALLSGASTIPEARRQGAQLALLDSRLRYGAEAGCDLAMMCTRPGSASQRNAERHGFRIAYTRIKWQLTKGAA